MFWRGQCIKKKKKTVKTTLEGWKEDGEGEKMAREEGKSKEIYKRREWTEGDRLGIEDKKEKPKRITKGEK